MKKQDFIKGNYTMDVNYKWDSETVETIDADVVKAEIAVAVAKKQAHRGEDLNAKSGWLFRLFSPKVPEKREQQRLEINTFSATGTAR